MIFLLDQDVPDDLAHWLRHRGHAVACLREVLPVTTPDGDVQNWAQVHDAVLVTCNRDDFLGLQPEGKHPGIVILIRRRTRQAEIAGMQRLLARAGQQGLANNVEFRLSGQEAMGTDRFNLERQLEKTAESAKAQRKRDDDNPYRRERSSLRKSEKA